MKIVKRFPSDYDDLAQDVAMLVSMLEQIDSGSCDVSIRILDHESVHEILDDRTMFDIKRHIVCDLHRQLADARYALKSIL